MARSYRPVIRDQEFLLPPNMAEWLPADHLVWWLIETVGELDTTAFHAHARRGGVGRQGYDPDMLVTLLLYAYAVGERSSRRIESLCTDHVAFRIACGQDAPDHSTIARFRATHEAAFTDLFGYVLRLCKQAGMVRVGVISIDGTKIAANASRGANRREDTVREQARKIAEDIVAEAAATDAEEDASQDSTGPDGGPDGGPRGGPGGRGASDRCSRAANIQRAMAELERQDAEDHRTDRVDQKRGGDFLARLEAGEVVTGAPPAGVDPVRRHQARVNRELARIAALEGVTGLVATRRRTDAGRALAHAQRCLELARQQAAQGQVDLRVASTRTRDRSRARSRANGSGGRIVNITDPDSRLMTEGSGGGVVQGYNTQLAVSDDHFVIGVHVSQEANDTHCFEPTLAAATATLAGLDLTIGTVLADAGYFTHHNLTIAGPARLIAPGKHRDVNAAAADEPTSGPPPPDSSPEDAMRHRLRTPEEHDIYKRRSATVETVIAHLKDQTGLRRYARRGLAAVTAETHLAATAVNLRRLHAATS